MMLGNRSFKFEVTQSGESDSTSFKVGMQVLL
jgi:hypothetical protein